ncbi:hypothetical protein M5D96_007920 [Drosophila gunungcola]|uniref:RING-type domain-containing protein n=2 Tax=Drosophila gunungcola TaxID=103775 RepID=A0A9P9YM92_9MUSC|nr:hypothetical protein M5D96_007920 [Drosophila gunungcola]
MNQMNELLEELQKLENSREQVHLEEPSSANETKRLIELELSRAQHFSSQRSSILLNLQQETDNFVAIRREEIQQAELDSMALADLCGQIRQINQELDRMYEVNDCPICQECCEVGGSHCLVSLRCGHLFGRNCIRNAIRKSKQCPICLRGARHSHMRRIYGLAHFPF